MGAALNDHVHLDEQQRTIGAPVALVPATPTRTTNAAALRSFVETHADFVFRVLRRLGLPKDSAEDGAQKVFLIATSKLTSIDPSRHRAFLAGIASNVALHARRTFARRREDLTGDDTLTDRANDDDPEQILLDREARATLDRLLAAMPEDLREVFVLAEIEELTMAEVAEACSIPPGTVASRLRRARAWFEQAARDVRSP